MDRVDRVDRADRAVRVVQMVRAVEEDLADRVGAGLRRDCWMDHRSLRVDGLVRRRG